MKTFKTKTGFGVVKDSEGRILYKVDLPIGEHKIKDEYTFDEYPTRESLSTAEVYRPPKSDDEIRHEKIMKEMYSTAEQRLIDKGEIQAKPK